jgi:hypothetical protein
VGDDFNEFTSVTCVLPACLFACLRLSMAGMYQTALRYAVGVRNLRERVPDTWVARGNEWVSLQLLMTR